MSGMAMVVVFAGAGGGALLRWWLGSLLNPVFPTIPLGTLSANLIGGLLVGVASAVFSHHTALPPEWRLLVITGFLGGLTTFSTFSLEVVTLIARHQYGWAIGTAGMHLAGSLALTAVGILIAQSLLSKV